MIRKKRTFRASDEEYKMIRITAELQGRTVSDFVRHFAMAEVKRRLHPDYPGTFYPQISEIIRKELRILLPNVGKAHSTIYLARPY